VVYKSGPIYKMLKYQEEWTLSRMAYLYLLVVVWVVLQVLWPANPSASWWSSCGQWRHLSYACYCLSLIRGWCVVYVGDASVCEFASSGQKHWLLPEFNGKQRALSSGSWLLVVWYNKMLSMCFRQNKTQVLALRACFTFRAYSPPKRPLASR
jgi:hypothetical protein